MKRIEIIVREFNFKEEGDLIKVFKIEGAMLFNSPQSVINFFSRVFVSDLKMQGRLILKTLSN